MDDNSASVRSTVGPYRLPPLPFAYDALEPVIDAKTMRLHHDGHHQGYVDPVTAALARHPQWFGKTIEEVLRHLPEDIRDTVRNQGGGHANHQFFSKTLTPGGAPDEPQDDLLAAIDAQFRSYGAFKRQFEAAAPSCSARAGCSW